MQEGHFVSPLSAGPRDDSISRLSSNNPYKTAISPIQSGEQLAAPQSMSRDRSTDSFKQVLDSGETSQSADTEKQVVDSVYSQQGYDSEKQVLSSDIQSGPSNAPIPVVQIQSAPTTSQPVRDAEKEVTSSWQSKSQDESAPIPMEFHESQSAQGGFLNDIKGEPPSYDSLGSPQRTESDELITTPSTIEPDGDGYMHPPRPEDKSTVGQLLAWMPPAPRLKPEQMPRLVLPVIVPQLDVPPQGESVPFARCYSDALASRDVSMRDFTAFLDGLAVARAPNSALQGLKMFGVGVSNVPLPLIPLAGRGIKALASSGSGGSGSRAKMYVDRAKKEYFEPRGLRLSIVKDNDLHARLQLPSHASKLAPLTKNTLTSSLCERRMEGLAPWVAPLRYDVPEQDKQVQGVHKLARKHLDHQFKDQAKRTTAMREEQWLEISMSESRSRGWDERYIAKLADLRRTQMSLMRTQSQSKDSPEFRELLDELRQDQRDLQVLVSERQTAMQNVRSGGRGVRAEMDEQSASQKLKWILIENM